MTLPTRVITIGPRTDPTTSVPSKGTLAFALNATLAATVSHGTLDQTQAVARLDSTGSATVSLVPNDVAELLPANSTYTVTENITGAPSRSYSITLPSGSGSIALESLTPANPVPAPTYSVPITGGTMTGPLTLSADPTTPLGAVTKEYSDAHSGVSSVNTKTGAVTLAAADVGADAAGAAASVLNGVTTTGTAAAQQIPIATGPTAATWAPLAQVVTQGLDGSPISSTVLANIASLAVPVAANQSYEFEFVIFYQGSVSGATGSAPNLNLTGPANSFISYVIEIQTGVSTFNEYVRTTLNSAQVPGAGVGNTTVEYVCRIRGRITTTASGTLQPQIAMGGGSFTGTVTVKAGSYGKAQGF